jgi:nitrite reductase/ring-hydroxylating ferredoxin subunit
MEWVMIFDRDDNRMTGLLVRGKRICLVQMEGRWLAVEDTCPHNGESLSKGSINFLGEVVCPWHGHRFNLRTGRECEQRSRDLETYPVKFDLAGLFIGL